MKEKVFYPPSHEIDGENYDLLMAIENGEEFEQVIKYDEFLEKSKQAAKNYFENKVK